MKEENELTYNEHKDGNCTLTEQQKYDIASVVDSLKKLAFFDDISERTSFKLNSNIKVLEALIEKEER